VWRREIQILHNGSESSRERKFHVIFALRSESSRERKFQGAKVPPMELSLPGAKVRGNESSSYRLGLGICCCCCCLIGPPCVSFLQSNSTMTEPNVQSQYLRTTIDNHSVLADISYSWNTSTSTMCNAIMNHSVLTRLGIIDRRLGLGIGLGLGIIDRLLNSDRRSEPNTVLWELGGAE